MSYGANGFSLAEAYAENLHGLEDSEQQAFPKIRMKQKRSVRLQVRPAVHAIHSSRHPHAWAALSSKAMLLRPDKSTS